MIDLSRPLDDVIELGEDRIPLNLSFDRVLKVLELWHDDKVHTLIKGYVALEILTGVNLSSRIDVEESFKLFELVFDTHIVSQSAETSPLVDLEGNPLPIQYKKEVAEKPVYSLVHDSDYIFASFMQAYNLDLIEQQGKLHWKKFNALLSGLPEDTRLIQVIKIRKWKPEKGDSSKHKEQMKSLQREFQLPEDTKY